MPLPDDLVATRRSLHALAEHVLAPALFRATEHIGLRQAPGGFATPTYLDGSDETTVGVSGTELHVHRAGAHRCIPLTTIRAAADLVGIEPGSIAEVYAPVTPLEPDRPLQISAPAALAIADLFEIAQAALVRLTDAHRDQSPDEIQLWPEHFDLATSFSQLNFGGCAGDDEHPVPYFYVGPWTPRRGTFWNESFGATIDYRDGVEVDEVVDFFERGLECAAADPVA